MRAIHTQVLVELRLSGRSSGRLYVCHCCGSLSCTPYRRHETVAAWVRILIGILALIVSVPVRNTKRVHIVRRALTYGTRVMSRINLHIVYYRYTIYGGLSLRHFTAMTVIIFLRPSRLATGAGQPEERFQYQSPSRSLLNYGNNYCCFGCSSLSPHLQAW